MRRNTCLLVFLTTLLLGVAGRLPLRAASPPALDCEAIGKIFGRAPDWKQEVCKVTIPRDDVRVVVEGVEVPPFMGMSSWAAFKAAPDGAAVTGDFALLPDEVPAVVHELDHGGITVTALHNHMLHDQPMMMFLHFWGRGQATNLATTLKRALDKMGKH